MTARHARVVDDHVAIVTLTRPELYFSQDLSGYAIVGTSLVALALLWRLRATQQSFVVRQPAA